MAETDSAKPASRPRQGDLLRTLLCFAAIFVILELAHGYGIEWLRWSVSTERCPPFAEGQRWWSGHVDLPERLWDTAVEPETGRFYNVFPPLLPVLSFLATAPLPGRESPAGWPEILPLLVFGLPLPLLAFAVFVRRSGSTFWGSVLTLGLLGGTAVLPCLYNGSRGGAYSLMHLMSQVGLLILTFELLGRRRMWLAVLGLLICAWSRQMTGLYAIALLYAAWRGGGTDGDSAQGSDRIGGSLPTSSADEAGAGGGLNAKNARPLTQPLPGGERSFRMAADPSRRRRMTIVAVGLTIIVGVPMGLNWAKFGSPFKTGYAWIYADRDDELAQDVREYGLFSTAFVPRNAYYMNAAVPWHRSETSGRLEWAPSNYGASLWLTTPVLLMVLLGARRWWHDPVSRLMMLCSIPVTAGLLCYHSTGAVQPGYYRFALDFVPVWLVVGAPWLTTGWRRWATLGCVAWSVTYFALLTRL